MKRSRAILLFSLALTLLTGWAFAQGRRRGGGGGYGGGGGPNIGPIVRTEGGPDHPGVLVDEDTVRTARETAGHSTEIGNWTNAPGFEKDVFTFARIIYKYGTGPRISPRASRSGWINDYPDSDLNLSFRIQQLTSMKVDPDGRTIKLSDPALVNYPFIYMVKAGRMELRDAEVPLLRKYLLNGGVLMLDDFWGTQEWTSVEYEIQRVLPGRNWTELPLSHPLFHCVFDIKVTDKNLLQVPSIQFYERTGQTSRNGEDSKDMHVRAWFDDKGRIMVIATHNTDNGDGWEREGEGHDYFQKFSEQRAYPLGINIIFYLMTH